MHSTTIWFYRGLYYGRCDCGWQSGGFENVLDTEAACLTHVQAQSN